MPNLAKLTRTEYPLWMRTLVRMGKYSTDPANFASSSALRHYLEYPQQQPQKAAAASQLALQLQVEAPNIAARRGVNRAIVKGARNALLGRKESDDDPMWLYDYGTKTTAKDSEVELEEVGRRHCVRGGPALEHPILGSSDPLSDDYAKALDTETLIQVNRHGRVQVRHRSRCCTLD